MKDKFFLINNYLPCICNCHENCLKNDLINYGIFVISMKEITKKEFLYYLNKLKVCK